MRVISATEEVQKSIQKFGITNDLMSGIYGTDKLNELGGIIPITQIKREVVLEGVSSFDFSESKEGANSRFDSNSNSEKVEKNDRNSKNNLQELTLAEAKV